MDNKSINKQKILIYTALLLDVLCIGVFIPSAEKFIWWYGISEATVGLSMTVYSLCAFFSAPILWQLGDRYGRKWPLILCVLWSLLSFVMLLVTRSFTWFLISRVINGITWWNISILQSIIADISTSEEDRKKNLWLMGAVFGLWFIIWPVFWSLLLSWGWSVTDVFLAMSVFSFVDLIILTLFLKETNHEKSRSKIEFVVFKSIWDHLKKPILWKYLISFFLLVFGSFIYQSMMSIFAKDYYGIWWEYIWYILGAMWLITIINMSILIPKFWIKKFNSNQIIKIWHIWLMVWSVVIILNQIGVLVIPSHNWIALVIWILTIALIGSIYTPIYQSDMIQQVPKNHIGRLNGVIASIQTIGMAIGPIVWWYLLSINVPLFLWSIVCVLISYLIITYNKRN